MQRKERGEPRRRRQGQKEFLAMMAASSATIAIAIDTMLPAFGQVRSHFGLEETSPAAALIITAFMMGIGAGQLVYGPLADRFGRKPVFIGALLVYVVAGSLTAMAPTLEGLLIGRFVWGLGAAGPRVVSQAMLRDRFEGDDLARAMAIVLTVFLIVPTLAPLLGQVILDASSWRATFAVGPVFGAATALWATRYVESLAPEHRRSLQIRPVLSATREVLTNRSVLVNTFAITMLSAAFLPYLGSAERIYGEIYHRGDQFALWFALTATVMACFTLASVRLVRRVGADRLAPLVVSALVVVAAAATVLAFVANGVPTFAVFVVATTLLLSLNTILTPMLTSRAMTHVGHIAGTAASTIGAISFVGGGLLATITDGAIATTVTPFAVGFLIFGGLAATATLSAR